MQFKLILLASKVIVLKNVRQQFVLHLHPVMLGTAEDTPYPKVCSYQPIITLITLRGLTLYGDIYYLGNVQYSPLHNLKLLHNLFS